MILHCGLLLFCSALLITAIPLDDFYPYGDDEGRVPIMTFLEIPFGQDKVEVRKKSNVSVTM